MIEEELEQPQQGAEGYQSPGSVPESDPGGIANQNDTGDSETGDILQALVNARPSWIDEPQPGAEGYQPPSAPFNTDAPPAFAGNKTDFQAPFPESTDTVTTPSPAASAASTNIYSFQMDDATDNKGAKVLIHDGEVSANGENGAVPTGMGNDDYILPINADGDSVWVEVTYDPATLSITSLTIGTGTGIPDSTLGNAYLLIGYVTFGPLDPTTGFPTTVDPHNTQCGDINIAFMYGAFNGQPALFLLSQLDAPQPVTIT